MTAEQPPRMPEPVLDDMWDALGNIVHLRLALNTLEFNLPADWGTKKIRRAPRMTAQTTTLAGTAAMATRIYWCACGWAGTGLTAMQDHLDRYDDGTGAHTEMAAL